MNNLFKKFSIGAAIMVCAIIPVIAQQWPGLYLTGGPTGTGGWATFSYQFGDIGLTNQLSILGPSTNTYIYQSPSGGAITTNSFNSPASSLSPNTNLFDFSCGRFGAGQFTLSFTGSATSTNDFLFLPSYDGGHTFAPTPLLTFSNISPGAATFYTNGRTAALAGVTDLGLVLRSRGTTPITNVLFELQFSSLDLVTNGW